MSQESQIISYQGQEPSRGGLDAFPQVIVQAGPRAARRFLELEFFAATIRNSNTRQAYARAVRDFSEWCQALGLTLERIEPLAVAAWLEQHPGSPQTVEQHLAAIRVLFDGLVTG